MDYDKISRVGEQIFNLMEAEDMTTQEMLMVLGQTYKTVDDEQAEAISGTERAKAAGQVC